MTIDYRAQAALLTAVTDARREITDLRRIRDGVLRYPPGNPLGAMELARIEERLEAALLPYRELQEQARELGVTLPRWAGDTRGDVVTGRRKDLQTLLRQAADRGAVVSRTGGDHYKVTTPVGVVILPSTPRGGRSLTNSRARLRRIGAL